MGSEKSKGLRVSNEREGLGDSIFVPYVYMDFLESLGYTGNLTQMESLEEWNGLMEKLAEHIRDIESHADVLTEEYFDSHYFVVNESPEDAKVHTLIRSFIRRNLGIFRVTSSPVGRIFSYNKLTLKLNMCRSVFEGIEDECISRSLEESDRCAAYERVLSGIQDGIDSGEITLLTIEPDREIEEALVVDEIYYGYTIKASVATMEMLSDWLSLGYVIRDKVRYILAYGKKFVNGRMVDENWYYLRRSKPY